MLQVITPPNAKPVDLAEARQHVKQDITTDDPLLSIYIGAAVNFAESETERAIMATRFRLVLDAFPGPSLIGVPSGVPFSLPGHAILLPRSPLLQLESIQYLDMGGTWQTMPAADYTVDDTGPVPRITPVFGRIWPITLPQIGSVRVNFIAGYATRVAVDASTELVTPKLWKTLQIGDAVQFSNSGGALPAPLQPLTDYYVQSLNGGAFKVAATPGGAAIDLTDAGSGVSMLGVVPDGIRSWLLLRIDGLFVHRGETSTVQGILAHMPYADRLLDPFRAVLL